MVVATTLVTACPPSLFLETPLYSHYHLFLRSFLKILSPVAHASLFSSPCPARFPPEETSPSHEKFKRGGNLRDSLSFPPPPSPSPSSRGIRGERRKADRKFRSLWIKVFSKLLSPLRYPHLPSSCKWRGFAETGEEELWTMFSIFVVVLNLPGRGEEEEEASFREWNSVPRLQDQPGEISGINSGLDIDFVKMPDRHHLPYERRVYRGEEGRDAWMIY